MPVNDGVAGAAGCDVGHQTGDADTEQQSGGNACCQIVLGVAVA